MKLFRTLFFVAMPRSSASASASVSGAGRRIAAARAIDAGTIASTRARRDAAPIAASIGASASASMPMWRATNSEAFSSSASGFRADMSMKSPREGRRQARRSGVLDELVVGGLVEQRGDLGWIGNRHPEEPARSERVAVGERRIGAQRFVDFDDFAADRHVQVGR